MTRRAKLRPPRPHPPRHIDIVQAFAERWSVAAGIPIDAGEPACFACGYYAKHTIAPWDERVKGPTPLGVLNRRWAETRLDRAHLVGYQFGGPNTPDNYALLCKRCHIDSPDVPDAETVVRWIAQRESWVVASMREVEALAPAGFVNRWEEAGSPGIDIDDMDHLMGGIHWAGVYGAMVSLATTAAIGLTLIEMAIERVEFGRTASGGQLELPVLVGSVHGKAAKSVLVPPPSIGG